jgi:hypothetical protein
MRFAGLQQVAVNCNYVRAGGKHIEVTVTYALPTDLNPNADFYFGCGNGDGAWTPVDRKVYVASRTQWAFATFNDLLGQISDGEAREFESVTRVLLRNADGYGHACSLAVKPTPLTSRFTFSFVAGGARGQGSFSTRGDLTRTGSIPVVAVHASDVAVPAAGAKDGLEVRIDRGIGYHVPLPTVASGRITLAVHVLDSKLSGCPRGATGTLTVTMAPSVTLAICGRSFLGGEATAKILEIS